MTSSSFDLVWLVPVLPLAGAAINLFAGKRLGRVAGWLASALLAASFAISLAILMHMMELSGDSRLFIQHLFDWITVGNFTAAADDFDLFGLHPLSIRAKARAIIGGARGI